MGWVVFLTLTVGGGGLSALWWVLVDYSSTVAWEGIRWGRGVWAMFRGYVHTLNADPLLHLVD